MQTWRDRDIREWHPDCRELYAYLIELGLKDHVAYGLVDTELLHWSKNDLAAVLSKVEGIESGLPKHTIPPRRADHSSLSSIVVSAREALSTGVQQLRVDASRTAIGRKATGVLSQAAESSYGRQLESLFVRAAGSQTAQDIGRSLKDVANRFAEPAQETWIRPPPALMAQSAEEGKALCVNRQGYFALREGGFFAISHVWVEGIQGDTQNRGLSSRILDDIFEKLQMISNVQWIWLDVVAIPTGNLSLNSTQELQKIDIINSLAKIYQDAETVVVFDALALHMRSRAPVDVAIALLYGRWTTRVWTLQEIKLAKRVTILTAQGAVDYQDMLAGLHTLNCNMSWRTELSTLSPEHRQISQKYRLIYMTLDVLDRNEEHGHSIPDVAFACRHRQTGNEIDYVRALFPVLELRWRSGMTKEDGLKAIYESGNTRYKQAAQVMTMFGRPRTMNYPGWAPDDLCGLDGDILYLNTQFEHTLRGLVHEWHAVRISSMRRVNGFRNAWMTALQHPDGNQGTAQCAMFHCDAENEATLSAMERVVSTGQAYFLTQHALQRRRTSGLFVERESTSGDLFAYAYAVLRVDAYDRLIITEKQPWTIRNENPMNNDTEGGRKRAELMDFMAAWSPEYSQSDVESLQTMLSELNINNADDQGRAMLHKAAVAGSNSVVQELIDRGAVIDAEDADKSTPLNLAAHKGRSDVLRTLLDAGADINHVGRIGTALTEAILSNSIDCAEVLLERGANVNGTGKDDFLWPVMNAVNKPQMLTLLLKFGADPNKAWDSGLSALHFAAREGNAETVRLLLEAGAQPSRMNKGSEDGEDIDPLWYAIDVQAEAAVAQLLYHGADYDAIYKKNKSPLICAAKVGNPKITRMLLDVGADVHRRADSVGTALDLARALGHRVVIKMLIEHGAS